MAQSGVEQQVHQLENRVGRIEKRLGSLSVKRSGFLPALLDLFPDNEQEVARVGGWILLTFSVLVLGFSWLQQTSFSLTVSLLMLVGIWLIIRTSGWIGVSASTLTLLQEKRSRRRISAGQVHHVVRIKGKSGEDQGSLSTVAVLALIVLGVLVLLAALGWYIYALTPSPAIQLLLMLVLPLAAFSYAIYTENRLLSIVCTSVIYLIFLTSHDPGYAWLCLLLFDGGVTFYAWAKQQWVVLLLAALCSYIILWYWGLALPVYPELYFRLISSVPILLLLFSLPFAVRRREADERQIVRVILVSGVVFLLVLPLTLGADLAYSTWNILIKLVLINYLGLGFVAWLSHERFSYAKYYALSALAVFLVYVGLYGQPVGILAWLILAILLCLGGIASRSYTVRMTGLGVTLASVIMYSMTLFSNEGLFLIPGLVTVSSRLLVGGLFAVFLVVLSILYRDLPKNSTEYRQVPAITSVLECAAFLLVFSLIGFETSSSLQTVLWLVAGIGLWVIGSWQKLSLVQSLGVAATLMSMVKLFFVDSLSLPVEQRVVVLVFFGITALGSAYLIRSKWSS